MITTQVALLAAMALGTHTQPPIQSQDRVKYDGHCLMIDGKDTFIYSGGFHYFRCPKPLWRDRFKKIKEAGFNTVETYIAWNWHEKTEPKSLTDYSKMDLTDFKDWLKMAHEEFGFYTIIRPGPYICAEWSTGGFPKWLLNKRPAGIKGNWLRTDDKTYLAWTKHYMDAVCPIIAKEQITHKPKGKPGTIMFQLENEYDYLGLPYSVMVGQLKALKTYARAGGIDVPLFTCWTAPVRKRVSPELSDVFDGSNLYVQHDVKSVTDSLASLRKNQTNAPVMVPELQGGWFGLIGGQLSEDQPGLDEKQIQAITLESILQGGTILNYYMLFGGSHLDDYAARTLLSTYDYNAPIREWGGVGARYDSVRSIGAFLKEYGVSLARSEKVEVKSEQDLRGLRVGGRVGNGGTIYFFVFNPSETDARSESITLSASGKTVTAQVDLKPFEYKVLVVPATSQVGEWYPKTPAPIARPTTEPTVAPITKAWVRDEPAKGGKWFPRNVDQNLVDLGVMESPFTLYRTHPELTAQEVEKIGQLNLVLNHTDSAVARINGTVVTPSVDGATKLSFPLKGLLKAGKNEIVVLHEDRGTENFGPNIDRLNFLRSGSFGIGSSVERNLVDWKIKEVPSAEEGSKLVGEDVDRADWLTAKISATEREGNAKLLDDRKATAVFTTELELTQDDVDSHLANLIFESIDDKGVIYVNGQKLATWNDWRTPCIVDATKALKVGKNIVSVIVTNTDGGGGLNKPVRIEKLASATDSLKWEVCTSLDGVRQGWWQDKGGLNAWKETMLTATSPLPRKGSDSPKGTAETLAKWYRTEFELPTPTQGTWYPWRALIQASGNGFVYLNGHPVGRYWQAGPQREFFLPENFLKFGPGKKNVLTFCLRPTDRGAVLAGVEISTYPGQGEIRK